MLFVCILNMINVTYVKSLYSRGAGQEVGRSCIMIEFKGKKIMVSQYSMYSGKLLQW